MKIILDNKHTYSRKDSILYENVYAIVKFKTKFIDVEKLSKTSTAYMQRYIGMFPDKIEILKGSKIPPEIRQLNLF